MFDKAIRYARNIRNLVVGTDTVVNNLSDLLWKMHATELSRLDVCRNEILLEMRYGQTLPPEVPTRIINQQKYDTLLQQNKLVLNIGCGYQINEGMINIDMRELPGVDVVADATNIDLPKEVAAGITCSHVLEHFPHEKVRRAILPHWVSLLRKGGYFRATVPDAEGMIAAFAEGKMSFENLRTVTFGLQEYVEDFHHTMFSRGSLRQILEEAGLGDVRFVATARPNGACLEMEVFAYK